MSLQRRNLYNLIVTEIHIIKTVRDVFHVEDGGELVVYGGDRCEEFQSGKVFEACEVVVGDVEFLKVLVVMKDFQRF